MVCDKHVLTWISGRSYCDLPDLQVFLLSLKHFVYDAKVYVFVRDVTDKLRHQCHQLGFTVVNVDGEVLHPVRDRAYYYWRYLKQNHIEGTVLHVDSRDVVFQDHPFQRDPEGCVFLVSEGMTHQQSSWNLWAQERHQERLNSFRSPYENWLVLNGGVIYGEAQKIAELFLLSWSNRLMVQAISLGSEHFGSDQAVLNYLYHTHLHYDPLLKVWTDHRFCITGEAIKDNLVRHSVRNAEIYNAANQKCLLFHQWDRTPYRQMILDRWQ